MRIGIIAYCLSQECRAISNYNYLYNILRSLARIDKENEYFLYSPVDLNMDFLDNPKWHVRKCRGLLNKSSTIWQLFFSKKYAINDNLDIFWATQAILVGNLPPSLIKILTVHDVKWKTNLSASRWDTLIAEIIFAERSILNADHLLISSHTTQERIKKLVCNNIESKSSVIHLGVSEEFMPYNKKETSNYIAQKYNTQKNYLLHLSVPSPIKNICTLLSSFKDYLDSGQSVQLLIAGGYGWGGREFTRTYRRLSFTDKQVKLLGYVPLSDLPKLYAGARAFITISLEEGFGLPLLEAMTSGTACICSKIDTFQEIASDAAFYVNPLNRKEIAEAIAEITDNHSLNSILREKAIARSKMFSWKNAAMQILNIFNMLCKK